VFSAIILWNPIPTPSITANRHAHPIAEFRAAFAPPLIARAPPVKKPAITFQFVSTYSTLLVPPPGQIPSIRLRASPTGIIWILLLPHSLHRTVERREQSSPNSKVSSQYRCSRFYRCEGANPSFAIWGVSKAFDTVPYCPSNCLK
jgi:hypothetical protein